MKTGILFDLDGTLLDTLEDLLDAANHALALFGYPPRTLEQMRRSVGNGAAHQLRTSMPEGASEKQVQQVLAAYKPYYTAHCHIKTRPYAGIPEALADLGRDFPLAIVSNKPDAAVKALCAQEFPGIFALGETPDCPRKPAPDSLYRAMAAIGAERCVYVGDSEVDVVTAKNAGVPCLSVLWGFRDEPELLAAGAKHLCREPGKLPEAIRAILKEADHGQ